MVRIGLQNEHLNNLLARLKIDLRFFNQELEEINNYKGKLIKKLSNDLSGTVRATAKIA